jgi:hypothetical protein
MGTLHKLPGGRQGDHKGRPYHTGRYALRRPEAMLALFASCDDAPGFTVELVGQGSLKSAIEKLFCVTPGDHVGTHVAEEIAEIEKMLRDGGDCAFEDGWMALRTLPGAISFLMGKVNDAVEEARFADEKRAAEYQNAAAAEARYCHLAGALRRALGAESGAIRQLVEG